MPISPRKFQQKILSWFDKHGRKNLPWQQHITPYRVWVSEIMLQQTQVTTVLGYFTRFMQRFPDVFALANAPIDDVLQLWAGLGYYARARNLQRSAKIIVEKYKGEFPKDLASLQDLPGIGRSTAGAILAISMQQQAAILDGNVKRVLSRCFAIGGELSPSQNLHQLWQTAEHYTPTQRVADYTQAMMDLGAMICSRSKPYCQLCPLQKDCLAYQQQRAHEFPAKKPAKKLPIRRTFMLLIEDEQKNLLLEKRPPLGIWGGLWSFPECENEQELAEICQIRYGRVILETEKLPDFRHTFSHFHLDITPLRLKTKSESTQIMEEREVVWYSCQQAQHLGIPQPIKQLLKRLAELPLLIS